MKAKSAERYATALDKTERARKELNLFADTLRSSEDLRRTLFEAIFTSEERKRVLGSLFKHLNLSTEIETFLFYVSLSRRFGAFFDIQQEFERQYSEAQQQAVAQVYSADKLSEGHKKKLKNKFEKHLNKKLEMTFNVDPSLLGGIVTKIGNEIFDGSLRTQLVRLEHQLEGGG